MGSDKVCEMESNGYKGIVLSLRSEGMSHEGIARYINAESEIDPDFTVSSNTIGRALNQWGDPNYRPPRSVTRGPKGNGLIYNYRENVTSMVKEGCNKEQIMFFLRRRGCETSKRDFDRVLGEWGLVIDEGFISYPWDAEI